MTRTATAEERALAAKIGRLFKAGDLDIAADLLATQLQAAYDDGYSNGYSNGYGEGEALS